MGKSQAKQTLVLSYGYSVPAARGKRLLLSKKSHSVSGFAIWAEEQIEFLAHWIQQPISELQIWNFTNFLISNSIKKHFNA